MRGLAAKLTVGPRFTDSAFLGVLLAVALLLGLPRFRGPIDLCYDSGVYYILGTALAGSGRGLGYRLLNEPGEIQAVQYPPLLPQRLRGPSVGAWGQRSYTGGAPLRRD